MNTKSIAVLALLAAAPIAALAHGTVPQQAAAAATSTAELFVKTQTPEIRRQFQTITASVAGHEQFDVVVTLKTKAQLNYFCEENEAMDPVVWECVAR